MIDKAISELYNDSLFISVCKKYGNDDFEDLRGIVIEQILGMDKEKVKRIIENDYLLPYCLTLVRHEAINKYSKFNKLIVIAKKGNMTDSIEAEIIAKESRSTDLWSVAYEFDEILKSEEINSKNEKIILQIKNDSLDQKNPYFFHAHVALNMMNKEKYKNAKQLSKACGIPYMTIRTSLKVYYKHLKSLND